MKQEPVYIVDGSRTPFIRARGRPGPFTPVDLAVACGRPLLLRQPFAPDVFDLVILGCVNVLADEMNPARIAALRLGMGVSLLPLHHPVDLAEQLAVLDVVSGGRLDVGIGSGSGVGRAAHRSRRRRGW